jgi:hypothetical protein
VELGVTTQESKVFNCFYIYLFFDLSELIVLFALCLFDSLLLRNLLIV